MHTAHICEYCVGESIYFYDDIHLLFWCGVVCMYYCVWGVCVMRKLGAFGLAICGLAIVNYETGWEYIDIECCNRLIACHIFFIQQWQKIIRASFSSEVLVRLNSSVFFFSLSLSFFILFLSSHGPCKHWSSFWKVQNHINAEFTTIINEIIHRQTAHWYTIVACCKFTRSRDNAEDGEREGCREKWDAHT